MGGEALAVALVSSMVSMATSSQANMAQKQIANDEERKRKEAQMNADARAEQIANDTKPEGEEAGEVIYGSGDDSMGSVSDFLVPVGSKLALGSSGEAGGLGFKI